MIPLRVPSLIMLPSALNLTGDKSISGNFIMDTGANYYLIAFSRFVRQNRLLLRRIQTRGKWGDSEFGAFNTSFLWSCTFIKVGSVVSKNVPVTLQASTGGDSSNHTDVDGSIGIQFFSDFNLRSTY